MKFNLMITAVAAIMPLVMGFIWYNPSVFGKAWMKECQFTPESIGKPNPMIFLYSYVLSFLLAFMLSPIVIHQFGMFSVLINEPGMTEAGSDVHNYFTDFMAKYGNNFRTFKHGALHGTMVGLLIALPILATNAMFEKKTFKYIIINSGYWIVTIALMGGIICQFA
ncbi:DUF1761 domain-containing protein [Bacteroidota bacterium]